MAFPHRGNLIPNQRTNKHYTLLLIISHFAPFPPASILFAANNRSPIE